MATVQTEKISVPKFKGSTKPEQFGFAAILVLTFLIEYIANAQPSLYPGRYIQIPAL
jgi:hypothetical protein